GLHVAEGADRRRDGAGHGRHHAAGAHPRRRGLRRRRGRIRAVGQGAAAAHRARPGDRAQPAVSTWRRRRGRGGPGGGSVVTKIDPVVPRGSTADKPFELVVTPASAGWTYSGLRIVDLPPGVKVSFTTDGDEMLVLPLSGG